MNHAAQQGNLLVEGIRISSMSQPQLLFFIIDASVAALNATITISSRYTAKVLMS
jgi:hypothetical protein